MSISTLVDMIARHSQKRDERTKTQLVLERYFKADVPRDVFLHCHRAAIGVARSLGVITKDEDFYNMQHLARVLYDFRCECAHSNRKLVGKLALLEKTKLDSYISIVRHVGEAVIRNYGSALIR